MIRRQIINIIRSSVHQSRSSSDVAGVKLQPSEGTRLEAGEETVPPLTDALGRKHDYLRISLTERCNLRCQYCMPAEGVKLCNNSDLLTKQEMLSLARMFARLGVTKVRLTGGEPTLRADLADLIEQLKALPGVKTVAITTNGLVLARRLPALQRAGLDSVNISLDTLKEEKYEFMTRRKGLSRVLAGIDTALQLGYRPLKINTVLMKDFNDDELFDFMEFTKDREVEVRFIEFMPFSGNAWQGSRLVPYRAALRTLSSRYELQALVPARSDTARLWQAPGYRGRVGFVASMTAPFCAGCNRIRLTADGSLKVCLFGDKEVSLKDAMRRGDSPAAIEKLVRNALLQKKPQHAAARRYCTDSGRGGAGQSRANQSETKQSETGQGEVKRSLTHVDATGNARMVSVSGKAVTSRAAHAACLVRMSPDALDALRSQSLRKGDACAVARIAGIQAAKNASQLLPLCHPLALDAVRVRVRLPAEYGPVRIECAVICTARTGAEMEALTGASVAALALYDMVKALDRRVVVSDLRLLSKSGGTRPDLTPDDETRSLYPEDDDTWS